MKKISAKWSMLALVLGTAVATGCSSGTSAPDPGSGGSESAASQNAALSMVTGHVTNDGAGSTDWGLGGAKTIDVARTINISTINPDGTLKGLVQGAIDGLGGYSVKVPTDAKMMIVQALDASGKVVGSAILEAAASAVGQAALAAPINTQSSLQAQALLDIAGTLKGSASLSANLVAQIRARIDAHLTAALTA
ncbi:MAG TPA: hypothetical protein VNO21_00765, partial [Polyangiaceae bacterium]|nr:hypothetical protein [Polyangiaceae bacterium]